MKIIQILSKIKYIQNQVFEKKSYFVYVILGLSLLASVFELLGIGIAFPAIAALISDDFFTNYNDKFSFLDFIFRDKSNSELIIFLFSLIIIVYFLKFLVLVLNKYVVSKAIFNLDTKISSKLFSNYLNCDFEYVISKGFSEVIKNIYTQSRSFTGGFLMCALNIFLETVTFAVIMGFLFVLNFKITLCIIFVSAIIVFAYISFFKNKFLKLGIDRVHYEQSKYQYIHEGVQGIKDIILFNKRNFFSELLHAKNKQIEKTGVTHSVYSGLPSYLFELFSILILCSVTILLFYLEYEKNQILLLITLFGFLIMRILPSIVKLVSNYQNLIFFYPSLDDIYDTLKQTNEKKIFIKKNTKEFKFEKSLEIKNINFKRNNVQILKNINLIIKSGSKIGIIGDSGSGKTTFINILMGILKQDSGKIFCDGEEVLNKNNLKYIDIFGHVPSNPFLFEGSFIENISLQKNDNDKILDQVILAAKKSSLHSLIESKEKKYDSQCGNDGSNMSAGQKQRVAIARAIFKKSQIYVFDESTNSLDKKTENDILEHVFSDLNYSTILFVSHNIQVVEKYCDEIYKIENSNIIKIK